MSGDVDFLALLRDESLQLAMFMACPDGVIVTDPDGDMILYTGAAEQLFGYEPVAAHSRSASMLFSSEGYHELRTQLEQAGMVANLSLSARSGQGRAFPVAVSASLIRDRSGQELATVIYVRDNTSVRAIEDTLRDNNSRLNSLVQELGHVARHDQLTGLLNRGSAFEAAEAALLKAAGTAPFGVALFDLDRFKHVNDSYGHIVGDEVLNAVAAVLEAAVREGDLIGRFGGEEFIAFLPGATLGATAAFAERARQAVSDARIAAAAEHEIRLKISAGVASIPTCADSLLDAIRVADDRLLMAKRSGRNRVISRPSRAHGDAA